MNKLENKKLRLDALESCTTAIKTLSQCYNPVSPAWILLQAAFGHINSIHHLESDTTFDEETLGVKGNNNE